MPLSKFFHPGERILFSGLRGESKKRTGSID
jgi:hypothetical protein